jgi:hypothetical protein
MTDQERERAREREREREKRKKEEKKEIRSSNNNNISNTNNIKKIRKEEGGMPGRKMRTNFEVKECCVVAGSSGGK